jgi:hypothetical protein
MAAGARTSGQIKPDPAKSNQIKPNPTKYGTEDVGERGGTPKTDAEAESKQIKPDQTSFEPDENK